MLVVLVLKNFSPQNHQMYGVFSHWNFSIVNVYKLEMSIHVMRTIYRRVMNRLVVPHTIGIYVNLLNKISIWIYCTKNIFLSLTPGKTVFIFYFIHVHTYEERPCGIKIHAIEDKKILNISIQQHNSLRVYVRCVGERVCSVHTVWSDIKNLLWIRTRSYTQTN